MKRDVTGTKTATAVMLSGRRTVIPVGSVVMHGRLNRLITNRTVMLRATLKPRPVRELDTEQENHQQQARGTGEEIAKALHTRGNNTVGRQFRQTRLINLRHAITV